MIELRVNKAFINTYSPSIGQLAQVIAFIKGKYLSGLSDILGHLRRDLA